MGEPLQDPRLVQRGVELLQHRRVVGHHQAIEQPVQQFARLRPHLQRTAGVAQGAADPLRAQRKAFGIQRRRAREHAEALSEEVHRQAGAAFLADGDLAQQRVLVDERVIDQAQHAARRRRGHGGRGLGHRPRTQHGQPGLELEHELRDQVGAIAAEVAQGLHIGRFAARMPGALAEAEQLLFVFLQQGRQVGVEFHRHQPQRGIERIAHAPGQVRRSQASTGRVGLAVCLQ